MPKPKDPQTTALPLFDQAILTIEMLIGCLMYKDHPKEIDHANKVLELLKSVDVVSSTSILDEINRKIDRDKREHYSKGDWSKDFEPADIFLTPERYISFTQEMHERYPFSRWHEDRKWRGASIRVVRTR